MYKIISLFIDIIFLSEILHDKVQILQNSLIKSTFQEIILWNLYKIESIYFIELLNIYN